MSPPLSQQHPSKNGDPVKLPPHHLFENLVGGPTPQGGRHTFFGHSANLAMVEVALYHLLKINQTNLGILDNTPCQIPGTFCFNATADQRRC